VDANELDAEKEVELRDEDGTLRDEDVAADAEWDADCLERAE
jgi:hypothetical protein